MGRLLGALAGTGAVLVAWAVLLVFEHLAVGFGWRSLFAGTWEMGAARNFVTPIALAAALPLAFVTQALGRLAAASAASPRARHLTAGLAGLAGGALAFGVSTGRHMQNVAVRAGFVLAVTAAGFFVARAAAPRLAALAARRPRGLAAGGAIAAVGFWAADVFVLPRLYPALHLGLFAGALGSAALMACAFDWRARTPSRIAYAAVALAAASAALVPFAARKLRTVDNLRLVLLDHAPLMGRVVALAATIAPEPGPDDGEGEAGGSIPLVPGEIARALDWSADDIVLLTVDALRADHVGAYGYPRRTTPNLDRLAAEGMVFEAAYCPTPHTSYSVTSMMTGKYMRPLLSVGLGEDSATWAGLLRTYGRRTAAFYPPAVFFIDPARFAPFERRGIDFEYRRVEFSSAAERADQVTRYLERAAPDKPLFLWVHLFEPHEPYVMHPEHPFGDAGKSTDIDAYDSEIASADAGIGRIVERVRAARPRAIVMVTADHGEEFGEHGGRYHGTTVYEEQVRVPLVVVGPGVARGRRVATPVQTIDLLPTTLSALGIPRPARLRGRDLGPILAGTSADEGFAFVETEDMTMVARGPHRLVCARRAAACALYAPKDDPGQRRDLAPSEGGIAKELRQLTAAVAREHGRLERGDAQGWPDALRRGIQGDGEAAEEVASLLDDVRADVRRKAAEVLFDLRAPATTASLRRALASADDEDVRRAAALALVRLGEAPSPLAEALLASGPPAWRHRAGLAYAERGDARGGAPLTSWWLEASALEDGGAGEGLEFTRAREIVDALGTIREREAVPALVAALGDVRLRPHLADALGRIGDARARAPLAHAFAEERYVPTRGHLGRALVILGATEELRAPLTRFAGLPDPMPEATLLAYEAKLLEPARGGWTSAAGAAEARVAVAPPLGSEEGLRLWIVLTPSDAAPPSGSLDGLALDPKSAVATTVRGTSSATDYRLVRYAVAASAPKRNVALDLAAARPGDAIHAVWLVAPSVELDPPPPEPWIPPPTEDVDPNAPGQ